MKRVVEEMLEQKKLVQSGRSSQEGSPSLPKTYWENHYQGNSKYLRFPSMPMRMILMITAKTMKSNDALMRLCVRHFH